MIDITPADVPNVDYLDALGDKVVEGLSTFGYQSSKIGRGVVRVNDEEDDGEWVFVALESIDSVEAIVPDTIDLLVFDNTDETGEIDADPPLGWGAVFTEPSSIFHRGDPNNSGTADLSDAIAVFNFLFTGGTTPACMESANTNNDARVDISDGVFLLGFLFLGLASPPPPGPPPNPCGEDTAEPDLGCETYDKCG